MDRCALFVDAGHLLAEGGAACLGTKERKEILCNYPALITDLETFAYDHCRLPILRTYWYDGAKDRVATPAHQSIALLTRVKLRLGQLTAHGQKGVDALIYHDVITLARERAIATAYLLAGDEDLREGVAVAQQMGMMVVLLGIKTGEQNQSPTLVAEADEHLWLPSALLAKHLSRPAGPAKKVTSIPITVVPAPAVTSTTSSIPGAGAAIRPTADPKQVEAVGRDLALQWVKDALSADNERLREALDRGQLLPPDIDRWLLLQAEKKLGSLRDQSRLRLLLRNAFRTTVQGALPARP